MTFIGKREAILLFMGDILCFLASLWLMLLLRYGNVPSHDVFSKHLGPFSILFAVWISVFFIAGLYEKHTMIFQGKLSSTLFNVEIINAALAIVFFYLVPYLGITPKTNLFIYLAISFILIHFWRLKGQQLIGSRKKQKAVLVGSGEEMKELREEVNGNARYGIKFISSLDLDSVGNLDFKEEILKTIYSERISLIAADLRNEKVEPILPNLYNLIFSRVRFVDMHKIYEDIFDRIPLSLVKYNWFLENISTTRRPVFDFVKRSMDILISLVIGILSLIFYPFIIIAILIEDGRPIFFMQERVGKNNKIIKLIKFRSMKYHNEKDGIAKVPVITKIGFFLRKTRLDEIPQLWSVFKGDISLIGPRPEIPALVKSYEKEIPYYNVRYLIKPGLSGWAQLYHQTPPKFAENFDETKIKLSYDLYYIKNRSLMLDIKVALKTLKTVISRSGV